SHQHTDDRPDGAQRDPADHQPIVGGTEGAVLLPTDGAAVVAGNEKAGGEQRGACKQGAPPDDLRGDLPLMEVAREWGDHLVAFDQLRRSEEHTSELQSREDLVCRLLLEKENDGKNIELL